MQREVSHVQESADHSVHITLPPQYCSKAVDAGWGQRHGLAGFETLNFLQALLCHMSYQYTLLYAPRDMAEI